MSQPAGAHMHAPDNRPARPVKAWTGWLIVAIIALPMLAAYLIFTTGWGIPRTTVNKGELLLPATSLQSLPLSDQQGQAFSLPGEDKRWRLLLVAGNDCDAGCRQLMYLARQVHVRLGDKAPRVERLYLNTAAAYDDALQQLLQDEYPLMQRLHVQPGEWQSLLADTSAAHSAAVDAAPRGERLYLVDQQGYVMMFYDSRHQGGEMLDDIKRLLKYSYDQ